MKSSKEHASGSLTIAWYWPNNLLKDEKQNASIKSNQKLKPKHHSKVIIAMKNLGKNVLENSNNIEKKKLSLQHHARMTPTDAEQIFKMEAKNRKKTPAPKCKFQTHFITDIQEE